MSPVILPKPLNDGTTAYGSEVKADLDALAAKFSEGAGGISDGDVSATAGISSLKLSNTAGKRILNDRIEDGAVDGRALKKDATAGSPNAAVNDATHVKEGVLEKQHLSTSAGKKVTKAQLELSGYNFTSGGTLAAFTGTSAPIVGMTALDIPIAWYQSNALSGDLIFQPYWSGTEWRLSIFNAHLGVAVNLTGITFSVVWIKAS